MVSRGMETIARLVYTLVMVSWVIEIIARPIYTLVTKGSYRCLFCLPRSEEERGGQANIAKIFEQNILTESHTIITYLENAIKTPMWYYLQHTV